MEVLSPRSGWSVIETDPDDEDSGPALMDDVSQEQPEKIGDIY